MPRIAKPERPDSLEAIAARLRLLRKAFSIVQGHKKELSQAEFARTCKIGETAYNNAEAKYQRLGLDSANRLRERTGVGLDFIYHGNRLVLPHALAIEIERLEAADAKAVKKAG
jgi:transcriptional regulator with XRE-family HTH domain